MTDTIANTIPADSEPVACNDAVCLRPRHTVRAIDGAYEVGVVLPGVKRESITVRLDDGVLAIDGRRDDAGYTDAKALYREIPAARFRLELGIRVPVDGSRISARFEDGVLTLRLPMKDTAIAREIPVE